MPRQSLMAVRDSMKLFHCIDPQNFAALKSHGDNLILRSAAVLMCESGDENYKMERRFACVVLKSGVVLRDQEPLTTRIKFSDGTTFQKYVEYLNEHVFFWYGETKLKNFCKKYSHHIVLRCNIGELKTANPESDILFCRYNAGAVPRNPEEHKRSLNMFKKLSERQESDRIVEIVVREKVTLPDETEYQDENGEWKNLSR